MDAVAAIVFHAFLDKSPLKQELLGYLSQADATRVKTLEQRREDPSLGFPRPSDYLHNVHSSWFSPFLRTLPESDIRLFLSSLSPEQVTGLSTLLGFSNHLPALSFLAAQYLKQTLFDQIAPSMLLPLACLPQSPLNTLLDLDHSEWDRLIDLMSMHDLSTEIRHIIETTKLKQIYEVLTPAQSDYLKVLTYKKEPVTFKKIGLTNWNGDAEALKLTLTQRGINRIAKALHSHESSLIWYLSHYLDIEKGTTLLKLCSPLDHPQAAHVLGRQVVDVISLIHFHTPG